MRAQVGGADRLEPDEQTAEPGVACPFEQTRRQNRLDGARGLPEATHPGHAVEEGTGEGRVAEEVVVEEVEVATGEAIDLGQSIVDRLRVELAATLEEGGFVAEVAGMGASAGNDDRVRNEVEPALN